MSRKDRNDQDQADLQRTTSEIIDAQIQQADITPRPEPTVSLIETLKKDERAYRHIKEIQELLTEGTKNVLNNVSRLTLRPGNANPLRKRDNEDDQSYDERLNRQLRSIIANDPRMRQALKTVVKALNIPFLALSRQQQNQIILTVSQWLNRQTQTVRQNPASPQQPPAMDASAQNNMNHAANIQNPNNLNLIQAAQNQQMIDMQNLQNAALLYYMTQATYQLITQQDIDLQDRDINDEVARENLDQENQHETELEHVIETQHLAKPEPKPSAVISDEEHEEAAIQMGKGAQSILDETNTHPNIDEQIAHGLEKHALKAGVKAALTGGGADEGLSAINKILRPRADNIENIRG